MMGRAKSGNTDLKTAIEALSWERYQSAAVFSD